MKKRLELSKVMAAMVVALGASAANAEVLECRSRSDFTATQVTIYRNAAMGFNGTLITMKSESDMLGDHGAGGPLQVLLTSLTGRSADDNFTLSGAELPIAPREACMPLGAGAGEGFRCEARDVNVQVFGVARLSVNDGGPVSFGELDKRARLRGNVEVNARFTPGEHQLQLALSVRISEPRSGREVHLGNSRLSCEVRQ